MLSELSEIKNEFEDLRKKYQEYLPKVDPALIDDLLKRDMDKKPGFAPMYMVEVFTKNGVDPQKFREFVMARSGQCPAIYDKGTHYAIHQRLTLEELREISNAEGVIEVTGDYCGGLGSAAPSHEHRSIEELRSPMI